VLDSGEVVGIEATFAVNVADFDNSWHEPGLYVSVWDDWGSDDPDNVLDEIDMEACTYDTRFDYEGDLFNGRYDLYNDCGDVEGSLTAIMALFPNDNADMLVLLELTMPTNADRVALDAVLNTLKILPAE